MNAPAQITNAQYAAANMRPDVLWNALTDLIRKNVKGFKTIQRSPIDTIKPDDLPALGIYLVRDRETPIGDPNTGEPKFNEYAHFGICGMIADSGSEDALIALFLKLSATRQLIYTDPGFRRLHNGHASGDMKLVYNRVGETPVASYEWEMVLAFETIWPPNVPDDYLRLHLTLDFPPGTIALKDGKPVGTRDGKPIQPLVERAWSIDQDG